MPDNKEEQDSKPTNQGKGNKSAEELMSQTAQERNEQGYIGTVPDPTPNHSYTLDGVTHGEPTPETDAELHKQAVARLRGEA